MLCSVSPTVIFLLTLQLPTAATTLLLSSSSVTATAELIPVVTRCRVHLPHLQAHAEAEQRPLQLSDCPLLALVCSSSLQKQLLEHLPSPACPDGSLLTLQHLMGEDWWRALPAAVADEWRRKASSSTWLFTPAASDLDSTAAVAEGGGDGADSSAAATASGHGGGGLAPAVRLLWALLVWWARWLVGDPIIVRQLKVRSSGGLGLAGHVLGWAACSGRCGSLPWSSTLQGWSPGNGFKHVAGAARCSAG
jgi:hypothetical protein